MLNKPAIIAVLATAASVQDAHGFVPPSTSSIQCQTQVTCLRDDLRLAAAAKSVEEDVELTRQVIMAHVDSVSDDNDAISDDDNASPIMDILPSPVTPVEPVAAATATTAPSAAKAAPKKKKKGGNPHKEGVFSPIVVAGKSVLGEEQLNQIRAKIIGLHSDIIKSFVATADSETGKTVLRQLFKIADTDDSGYLDKQEVMVALNLLGFKWLGEKQVDKIFARADANGDLEISLEEFMEETPKTLKLNLVKLAKQNGGEMGLLV